MPREGSCSAGPEGGAIAGECPNPRLQVDCEKHDDLCARFGVTGDGEPMLCLILADCTHSAPRPSELVSTDFDPHAPLRLSWQRTTRPAHRNCCGSATALSSVRMRVHMMPKPSRLGLLCSKAARAWTLRGEGKPSKRRVVSGGFASREAQREEAGEWAAYSGSTCAAVVTNTRYHVHMKRRNRSVLFSPSCISEHERSHRPSLVSKCPAGKKASSWTSSWH